jgi:hypothetical protein
MQGVIINPKVLAFHTIPRPQQPQEEAQQPTLVVKIPNPKQATKQEP